MIKKKIKDITIDDIKGNWGKLFDVDEALCLLFMKASFTESESVLEQCKKSCPKDLLEKEIELEVIE